VGKEVEEDGEADMEEEAVADGGEEEEWASERALRIAWSVVGVGVGVGAVFDSVKAASEHRRESSGAGAALVQIFAAVAEVVRGGRQG
jgi:hypothetical protein